MLSHPGSVDVLDGTAISGFGNEPHLTHQNSSNTLSPFTIAKHPKPLQTQHSYQGTLPGYNHSRTASMTASMEVKLFLMISPQDLFLMFNISQLSHYVQILKNNTIYFRP